MEYYQEIKAIPTLYKGQLFASRLKARWAVFFDAVPIKWVYKPRGYFPDFWLPQVNMWAESKPVDFTSEDYIQSINLVMDTKYSLLLLVGSRPKYRPYYALEYYEDDPLHVNIGSYGYMLSNCEDYPEREHRFYFTTSEDLRYEDHRSFNDTIHAIQIAKEMKFDADSGF